MNVDVKISEDGWEDVGTDLVREEAMLSRHLELLEDFVKRDLRHTVPLPEERCRGLREKIETAQKMIAREGKGQMVQDYLQNPPESVSNEEFKTWLKSSPSMHMAHTRDMQTSQSENQSSFASNSKRPLASTSFEYSFPGPTSTKRRSCPETVPFASHIQPKPLLTNSPLSTLRLPTVEPKKRGRPSKKYFDRKLAEEVVRGDIAPAARAIPILGSSARANFSDPQEPETPRSTGLPCLRCKILKRKCDLMEHCSHCPKQGFDNQKDYWKVLGCFRGGLKELSDVFLPDHFRSKTRTYGQQPASAYTVDIALRKPSQFLNISAEVGQSFQGSISRLEEPLWEDISTRHDLSTKVYKHLEIPLVDTQAEGPFADDLKAIELPWRLLQIVRTNRNYERKTAYNLFTLMRLSNETSEAGLVSWDIFSQCRRLLFATTELYLQEEQISREVANAEHSLVSTKTLETIDIKIVLEDFLQSFESVCSGRGKLTGQKQLACFYSLLLFGIFKSLLIDSYSLPTLSDSSCKWNGLDTMRINSRYKALVSVFIWSSKTDLMLESDDGTEDNDFIKALRQTRLMLRTQEWTQQNITGSKEFLLSLGTYLDGDKFHGFFVQRFGLDELPSGALTNESIADDVVSNQSLAKSGLSTFPISKEISGRISGELDGQISTLSWEHIYLHSPAIPSYNLLLDLKTESHGHNQRTISTTGKRTGKLHPEIAEKAKRMRKVKACWKCWAQKVPVRTSILDGLGLARTHLQSSKCSEGDVCERCTKLLSISPMVCIRTGFKDYEESFFPEFLHSHLKKQIIEDMISEHTAGFTDTSFATRVTFDRSCSVVLVANLFRPRTDYLLNVSPFQQKRNENFVLSVDKSLPLGIIGLDQNEVRKIVKNYLNDILTSQVKPASRDDELDPSAVSNQVFEILWRFYCQGTASLLLRQSMSFFLLQIFSEQALLLARPLPKYLKRAMLVEDQYNYTSRLLDHQIKYIMHKVAKEMLSSTLEGLERSLRSRTKDDWPVTVTVFLMLSLCIEGIEIAAASNVDNIANMTETNGGLPKAAISVSQRFAQGLCKTFTDCFHMVYRSGKVGAGWSRDVGFNPIKEAIQTGLRSDSDLGLDDNAAEMVQGLARLILDSYTELRESSKPPNFAEEPEVFSKKNKGRLVSQFLLSFVDDEAIQEALMTRDTRLNSASGEGN